MNSISIIIPVYKEVDVIKKINDKIKNINNENKDFEIIIVDDGNDIPIKNDSENDKIKVVRNETNKGYGYSIKKGVRIASHSTVAIIDADDTYDFNFIFKLKENFKSEHDLIVGKRVFLYNEGFLRKGYRFFINKFSSLLFSYKILDLNSGIRVFDKKYFLKFEKYFPDKFSITSTQTLIYVSKKYNLKYLETTYNSRTGRSKINIISDPLNFVLLILKIHMIFSPIKFFGTLGLILIIMGLILGIISLILFDQITDVSVLLLVLFGLNSILFGLLAESIRLKNND